MGRATWSRAACWLLVLGAIPAIVAQTPNSAVEALRKGKLAAGSKQWAVAIRYFDEARLAAPALPEPLFTLGLAEGQLPGRELRAIGWFRAYLELAPDASNAPAVRNQIDQLDISAEGRANEILSLLTQVAAQFPAGAGKSGDAQSAIAAVTGAIAEAGKSHPVPFPPDVPMSAAQRAQAWCDYVQKDLGTPLFLNLQATLVQAQSVSGNSDDRAWTVFSHVREQADSWIARLSEVRNRFPEQRLIAEVLTERARKTEADAAEARAAEVRKTEDAKRKAVEARAAAWKADFENVKNNMAEYLAKFAAEGGPTMVAIPPGEFTMGSRDDDLYHFDNQGPQTRVVISRPFFIGATALTQSQWTAVMGNNPSSERGNMLPIENVSWFDAMAFCQKLTERERADNLLPAGWKFTLPTEAQWEYACRAGSTGTYAGEVSVMGWYMNNSGNHTHPVGTKQPNAWKLFDMHGNICEWCLDWYATYTGGSVIDPKGPSSGSERVIRNGSAWSPVSFVTSASRAKLSPTSPANGIGFRITLIPMQ